MFATGDTDSSRVVHARRAAGAVEIVHFDTLSPAITQRPDHPSMTASKYATEQIWHREISFTEAALRRPSRSGTRRRPHQVAIP
jgi:hypothetical protein